MYYIVKVDFCSNSPENYHNPRNHPKKVFHDRDVKFLYFVAWRLAHSIFNESHFLTEQIKNVLSFISFYFTFFRVHETRSHSKPQAMDNKNGGTRRGADFGQFLKRNFHEFRNTVTRKWWPQIKERATVQEPNCCTTSTDTLITTWPGDYPSSLGRSADAVSCQVTPRGLSSRNRRRCGLVTTSRSVPALGHFFSFRQCSVDHVRWRNELRQKRNHESKPPLPIASKNRSQIANVRRSATLQERFGRRKPDAGCLHTGGAGVCDVARVNCCDGADPFWRNKAPRELHLFSRARWVQLGELGFPFSGFVPKPKPI